MRVLVRVNFGFGEQEFDNILATVLGGNDERRRALDVALIEQRRAALLENELDELDRAEFDRLVQRRRLLASRALKADVGAVGDEPTRKLLVDVLEQAEREWRAELVVAVVHLRALLFQIGEHRRVLDVAERSVVENQRIVFERHAVLLDQKAHNVKVGALRRQAQAIVPTCVRNRRVCESTAQNKSGRCARQLFHRTAPRAAAAAAAAAAATTAATRCARVQRHSSRTVLLCCRIAARFDALLDEFEIAQAGRVEQRRVELLLHRFFRRHCASRRCVQASL